MNTIVAKNALKDAARTHKAITCWLAWCEGLGAAKNAAGLYGAEDFGSEAWISRSAEVERVYMAANKCPGMPSKDAKHRMYDNAYRAASLAGMPAPAGSLNSMEDVARVIAQVTAAHAKVESTCRGCGVEFNGKRGLTAHQTQRFVTLACRPQI